MTQPKTEIVFNRAIADALTRVKLKESEIQLLKQKIKICDNTIISSIKQFTYENTACFNKHKNKVHIYVSRMEQENYTAYNQIRHKITNNNSQIMINCIKFIDKQLNHWKGYQSTKHIDTFDEYFEVAKTCWNKQYSKMISEYFSTFIYDIINKFAKNAANQFFGGVLFNLQQLYVEYLQALISKDLFQETKSKFANLSNTTGENKVEIYKIKFQNSLLALHYEVDNYSEPNCHGCRCMYTIVENDSNTENTVERALEMVDEAVATPIVYTGKHKAQFTVKEHRYNPLGQRRC
eukprot:310283_1